MATDVKVLARADLSRLVAVVLGTRPGIVMLAPVLAELRRRQVPHFVIHTGQHYSPNMDAQFFADLRLAAPEYRIDGVASRTTHGAQTATMLEGIETILFERRPALVLVGGDANTNLAGALAARKLGIAVGHIEAGERSFDWSMPEEHNRRMIDHISDLLFATGEVAERNLAREGVLGRVVRTGNTIVDASLLCAAQLRDAAARADSEPYGIVTMHREENVDNVTRLKGALEGVSAAAEALALPLRFYVHPRTRKRLQQFDLEHWAQRLPGISCHEPLGYLDFLGTLIAARLAFTDSGGVQQEACIHRVPCVTLRENTEWTETLEIGANRLAGCAPDAIVDAAREALSVQRTWDLPFGDGRASARIVDCVEEMLTG